MSARRPRTPLYEKIYRELRTRIDSGQLREGDQVPTELELADEFHVSRGTARQAISRLVQEGAVERTAGRGTFVLSRRLVYTARELLGFTEQIRATGRTPSSEVMEISIVQAAGNSHGVDFGPGVDRLLSIERVRKADDEPVALEHLLVPFPRFAGLRDIPLETTSIYDSLEEQFGVRLRAGEFTLDIADLTPRQAARLAEPEGTAVFLMSGTVTDQGGQPIVAVHSYYSRRKYSFTFSIPRENPVTARYVPTRLVLSP